MNKHQDDPQQPFGDITEASEGLQLFNAIGLALVATVAIPFLLGVLGRFWYGLLLFGWHVFPPL